MSLLHSATGYGSIRVLRWLCDGQILDYRDQAGGHPEGPQ